MYISQAKRECGYLINTELQFNLDFREGKIKKINAALTNHSNQTHTQQTQIVKSTQ